VTVAGQLSDEYPEIASVEPITELNRAKLLIEIILKTGWYTEKRLNGLGLCKIYGGPSLFIY
jgi:hypothetical protein